MQLKITKILNKILIGISLITIAIIGGFFYVSKDVPGFLKTYLTIGCIVVCVMFIAFWQLELRLDKYFIEKMVKNEKIALANITEATKVRMVGDSVFRGYWLYNVQVDIYDPKTFRCIHTSFVEKFDLSVEQVPTGTVYLAYDENMPDCISLIPLVLLYQFPELEKIVKRYESKKNIPIKYVDVYYKRGFVIRTMKEKLNEAEENGKEAKENPKKNK